MMVATRSIEECSASEVSASEPMAMPTTSFAAAMLPLAKIEIAATEVFLAELWVSAVMGGGLAGRRLTSSSHPHAQAATHSQERFVANCSEFNEQELQRHHDFAEVLVGFHVFERPADVGELVDLVDRQLQLAALHGSPDVLAHFVKNLADFLDAAGT